MYQKNRSPKWIEWWENSSQTQNVEEKKLWTCALLIANGRHEHCTIKLIVTLYYTTVTNKDGHGTRTVPKTFHDKKMPVINNAISM